MEFFSRSAATLHTANGTVDRRALHAWPRPDRHARAPDAAVATAMHERLASIWGEVLGVPCVGLDDNFFDLGGHSLLAMRVIARVSSLSQRSVPLQALFAAPTIRQFACEVERSSPAAGDALAVPRPTHRENLSVTLNQEKRLIFEEGLRGNRYAAPPFNLSLCLRLDGDLRVDALEGAVDALARRHEVVHASFVANDRVAGAARERAVAAFMRTGIVTTDLFSHSVRPGSPVTIRILVLDGGDPDRQAVS